MIHVGGLNSEGTEMKALNATSGIGYTGMKEVQSCQDTHSENWPWGQSTARRLCSSAAAVLHFCMIRS